MGFNSGFKGLIATEIGTVTNVKQWIGIKLLTVTNSMRNGIFRAAFIVFGLN